MISAENSLFGLKTRRDFGIEKSVKMTSRRYLSSDSEKPEKSAKMTFLLTSTALLCLIPRLENILG